MEEETQRIDRINSKAARQREAVYATMRMGGGCWGPMTEWRDQDDFEDWVREQEGDISGAERWSYPPREEPDDLPPLEEVPREQDGSQRGLPPWEGHAWRLRMRCVGPLVQPGRDSDSEEEFASGVVGMLAPARVKLEPEVQDGMLGVQQDPAPLPSQLTSPDGGEVQPPTMVGSRRCSAEEDGDDLVPPVQPGQPSGQPAGSDPDGAGQAFKAWQKRVLLPGGGLQAGEYRDAAREWARYASWGLVGQPEVWPDGGAPHPPAPPPRVQSASGAGAPVEFWETMLRQAEVHVEEMMGPAPPGEPRDAATMHEAKDKRSQLLWRKQAIRSLGSNMLRQLWRMGDPSREYIFQAWLHQREVEFKVTEKQEEERWEKEEETRREQQQPQGQQEPPVQPQPASVVGESSQPAATPPRVERPVAVRAVPQERQALGGQQQFGGPSAIKLGPATYTFAAGPSRVSQGAGPSTPAGQPGQQTARRDSARDSDVYIVPWKKWTAEEAEKRTARVHSKAAARRHQMYTSMRSGAGCWGPKRVWPTQQSFERWVEQEEEKVRSGAWLYQSRHLVGHGDNYTGRPPGSRWGDSESDGESHYHVLTMTAAPWGVPQLHIEPLSLTSSRPTTSRGAGQGQFPLFRQQQEQWGAGGEGSQGVPTAGAVQAAQMRMLAQGRSVAQRQHTLYQRRQEMADLDGSPSMGAGSRQAPTAAAAVMMVSEGAEPAAGPGNVQGAVAAPAAAPAPRCTRSKSNLARRRLAGA